MTIFWALAAAPGFGIADLCAREASQKETTLKTLWYLQLIGIPTSLLFVIIGRQFPWAAIFSWSGLAGAGVGLILSVGTIFLYRALAVDSGLTSVASVITSLYSVVTVVLGYLIWKERIIRVQQAGVLLTLVGIVLVSP